MDAEEFIDATIANLKIIGMLQRNDKIRVHKGQISIDRGDAGSLLPTLSQAMRRWMNRDSRDVTLIHLRNTVGNAIRITRALAAPANIGSRLPDGSGEGSRAMFSTKPTGEMRDWTLQRLINEMQAAEMGLQNLRATYNDDSSMMAAVDVLMDRLRINSDDVALGGGAYSAGAYRAGACKAGAYSAGAYSAGACSAGAYSAGAYKAGAYSAGAYSAEKVSSGAAAEQGHENEPLTPIAEEEGNGRPLSDEDPGHINASVVQLANESDQPKPSGSGGDQPKPSGSVVDQPKPSGSGGDQPRQIRDHSTGNTDAGNIDQDISSNQRNPNPGRRTR
jgi:hypothetical protein